MGRRARDAEEEAHDDDGSEEGSYDERDDGEDGRRRTTRRRDGLRRGKRGGRGRDDRDDRYDSDGDSDDGEEGHEAIDHEAEALAAAVRLEKEEADALKQKEEEERKVRAEEEARLAAAEAVVRRVARRISVDMISSALAVGALQARVQVQAERVNVMTIQADALRSEIETQCDRSASLQLSVQMMTQRVAEVEEAKLSHDSIVRARTTETEEVHGQLVRTQHELAKHRELTSWMEGEVKGVQAAMAALQTKADTDQAKLREVVATAAQRSSEAAKETADRAAEARRDAEATSIEANAAFERAYLDLRRVHRGKTEVLTLEVETLEEERDRAVQHARQAETHGGDAADHAHEEIARLVDTVARQDAVGAELEQMCTDHATVLARTVAGLKASHAGKMLETQQRQDLAAGSLVATCHSLEQEVRELRAWQDDQVHHAQERERVASKLRGTNKNLLHEMHALRAKLERAHALLNQRAGGSKSGGGGGVGGAGTNLASLSGVPMWALSEGVSSPDQLKLSRYQYTHSQASSGSGGGRRHTGAANEELHRGAGSGGSRGGGGLSPAGGRRGLVSTPTGDVGEGNGNGKLSSQHHAMENPLNKQTVNPLAAIHGHMHMGGGAGGTGGTPQPHHKQRPMVTGTYLVGTATSRGKKVERAGGHRTGLL